MKHTSTALCGLISGLLVLTAAIASSTAAITTVPAGLNPGDNYRLIFVTDGATNATSTAIADYNAFVAAEATAVTVLLDLGTTWTVIGSTATVAARDNTGTNPATGTGVPIFDLSGVKIADNNADLWDGSLDNTFSTTPTGLTETGEVFTGTGTNGLVVPGISLGPDGGIVNTGGAGAGGLFWIPGGSENKANALRLYAVSDEITFVPEPSSALLGLVGIATVVLRRRRS